MVAITSIVAHLTPFEEEGGDHHIVLRELHRVPGRRPALLLDAQHRVIACEELFHGTLTQTCV